MLIALLSDQEWFVRDRAAQALGQLQAPAAIPQLIALLSDQAADVRRSAAQALGQLQAPAAIPQLIALLSDQVAYVRRNAAQALGRLQAIESVTLLSAIARNSSDNNAQPFIMALLHLSPLDAQAALELSKTKFRHKSWPLRLYGHCLQLLAQPEQALANFQEAVQLENNSDNLSALVHWYIEQGDLSQAQEHAVQIELEDSEEVCRLTKALLSWLQGDQASAISAFRDIVGQNRYAANPKDLQYHYFWGPRALAALEELRAASSS